MLGAILKATNISFQNGMTFCRSMHSVVVYSLFVVVYIVCVDMLQGLFSYFLSSC